MLYTLENERLRLRVDAHGAQMRSLMKKENGCEYLWPGNAATWKDSAPWLFPFIGQMKDGRYVHAGRDYRPPLHGFAKDMDFSVVQTERTLEMTLTDTPDTLRCFPWRFELTLRYTLIANEAAIEARVRCREEKDMLFSFGAHPGFLCEAGDTLSFAPAAPLRCCRLTADTHLLDRQTETLVSPDLRLEERLFAADAMILCSPAATQAHLRRKNGRDVRFFFDRSPFVGVWSKPGAGMAYVCVEPWFGVDDTVDASGALDDKLGVQRLPAGEVFATSMRIVL